MTDLEALVARLSELLEKATPRPWTYRPDAYDDWGFVRGAETEWDIGTVRPIVAVAKSANPNEDLDEHRRNKTDPYEPNGRLITEAVNAIPTLLTALRTLFARVEEVERERDEARDWLTGWYKAVTAMLTIAGLSPALGAEEAATELRDELDRRDAALAASQERIGRYERALDPNETKHAYIGEVKDRVGYHDEFGDEAWINHTISWDATKAIMAMIRARAALSEEKA